MPDFKQTRASLSPFLRHYSLLILILMSLATVFAFGVSIWYFAGFAENDGGGVHLFSAALICFGVGALFYLPAYWTARRAYRTIKEPQIKHRFILPAFFGFPWLVFGFFLQAMDGWWVHAGWAVSAMGMLAIGWTWALLRRA